MVAVHSRRRRHRRHTGAHKLQDGHLGRRILAGHATWSQLQIRLAPLDVLAVRVVEMRIQDLLTVREGSVEARAYNLQVLVHLLVVDVVDPATTFYSGA